LIPTGFASRRSEKRAHGDAPKISIVPKFSEDYLQFQTQHKPILKTFYHPCISKAHAKYLDFPEEYKTFDDALEHNYSLTCCIQNEGQGQSINHCVVLLEKNDRNYIFKNSTKSKPSIEKSITAVEIFNLSNGGKVRLPDPVEGKS
jgi:hypothetical protein